MAGWRVLDRLKHDLSLRHMPVCVISTDDSQDRAFQSGALAFLEKPIQSKEVLDGMLEKLHGYVARRREEPAGGAGRSRRAQRAAGADRRRAGRRDGGRPAPQQMQQALDEGRFDAWCWRTASAAATRANCAGAIAAQAGIGPVPLILYRGAGCRKPCLAFGRRHHGARSGAREVRLFDAALMALHRSLARLPEMKRNVIDDVYEAAQAAGRQARADRRRRHAQHLRAGHGAGRARHGHRLGRQRPRSHQPRGQTTRASTSC